MMINNFSDLCKYFESLSIDEQYDTLYKLEGRLEILAHQEAKKKAKEKAQKKGCKIIQFPFSEEE